MGRVLDAECTPRSPDRQIAELSATQHGVFSRSQAHAAGLSKDAIRRRVESARWRRLDRDVFVLEGSPMTRFATMMAACLSLWPDALASHLSAASLWQLPGFQTTTPIEISADRARRRRNPPYKVHWTEPIPDHDRTFVNAIPVTSLSRTILDIAGAVAPELLEEAVDDALRRRLASVSRLQWQLEKAGRRRGVADLRALLDSRDPTRAVPESVLETKVARILRKAKLPGLVAQYNVVVAGHLIARVDFAFPAAKVAVEADGYRWHSGRAQWQQDLERRNALTNLGWRVIHVTWEDLKR